MNYKGHVGRGAVSALVCDIDGCGALATHVGTWFLPGGREGTRVRRPLCLDHASVVQHMTDPPRSIDELGAYTNHRRREQAAADRKRQAADRAAQMAWDMP